MPPNWLALIIFIKLTKKVKVIVDILDLWPEAFPHNNNFLKKFLILILGIFPKLVRKLAIKRCDYCLTESDYFYKKLKLFKKENSKTLLLKKTNSLKPNLDNVSSNFTIVYLGNIGYIYDFETLFKIILGLNKRHNVVLHIIGSGPRKNWMLKSLDKKNIKYQYHGISFDEDFKSAILSKCWFGYNGYKSSTEVALSYKTIDYLSAGVPILNLSKADTEDLVKKEKIGLNIDKINLESFTRNLSNISIDSVYEMKQNAYKIFLKNFSISSLNKEMDTIIDRIYK